MIIGKDKHKYNPILVRRFFYSVPLHRRILARFFEKYKITEEEFDDWYYKILVTDNKKQ